MKRHSKSGNVHCPSPFEHLRDLGRACPGSGSAGLKCEKEKDDGEPNCPSHKRTFNSNSRTVFFAKRRRLQATPYHPIDAHRLEVFSPSYGDNSVFHGVRPPEGNAS